MNMPSSLDPELIAPPLSYETTFLSLDVESNGLHGAAFAVGAVLMKADGELIDSFKGRIPIRGQTDSWVKENVLPKLSDFPINFRSAKAMRSAFWEWFMQAKPRADYVLVNNGYPVEARFLLASQADDIKQRGQYHPFPLLELNSLLLAAGIKPLAEKNRLVKAEISGQEILHHNPLWDAKVAVLAAVKALAIAGQLK